MHALTLCCPLNQMLMAATKGFRNVRGHSEFLFKTMVACRDVKRGQKGEAEARNFGDKFSYSRLTDLTNTIAATSCITSITNKPNSKLILS